MKNWILGLLVLVLAGCGSGDGASQPTVEDEVYANVVGLGDASGDAAMFQAAFVSGAAPENREDYSRYAFVVDGTAEISGDEATVPVKVIGGIVSSQGDDSAAKKKTGEKSETKMTWKLQREGKEWKLKEAPLPG
ncbi:hypothetical protein Enr10x_14900 [Gimesia panareensis]|uniref:DUF4878 domain-containing protein n=1 Tax=Gimesia panareensis TaxID=2527978 RepID=A0A517Q3J5_9PLAN|nr:hypothetical protein [Gimesia panareensis]QDT26189.1 hypothetical protein Enr10x_14900 [Gimesia panareensis]